MEAKAYEELRLRKIEDAKRLRDAKMFSDFSAILVSLHITLRTLFVDFESVHSLYIDRPEPVLHSAEFGSLTSLKINIAVLCLVNRAEWPLQSLPSLKYLDLVGWPKRECKLSDLLSPFASSLTHLRLPFHVVETYGYWNRDNQVIMEDQIQTDGGAAHGKGDLLPSTLQRVYIQLYENFRMGQKAVYARRFPDVRLTVLEANAQVSEIEDLERWMLKWQRELEELASRPFRWP
jgi:hypothetical protein